MLMKLKQRKKLPEIKILTTTYILRFAVVDCVCYNEDFVKLRFCCINFYCNFGQAEENSLLH